MSRNRDNVEYSLAEIKSGQVSGPLMDPEEAACSRDSQRHDRRLRQTSHLIVAGDVIAVAMGMGNDQGDLRLSERCGMSGSQSLNRCCKREDCRTATGAGI